MKTDQNTSTIRAFLAALASDDAAAVANLFATDASPLNPHQCGVFPKGAEGTDQIEAYWAPVVPIFDGMAFSIHQQHLIDQLAAQG